MKTMIVRDARIALGVIAIVCMAGCAMEPATTTTNADMQPPSSGEGSYVPGTAGNPAGQCGAKTTFFVNTDQGVIIVDVPANCNPSVLPDVGDPAPDYASDPNPWEKNLNGTKINPSLDTKR